MLIVWRWCLCGRRVCCEEVTRQERRQPGRQIKFRLVGFRSVKDNGQQRARRAKLFFFLLLCLAQTFFPSLSVYFLFFRR